MQRENTKQHKMLREFYLWQVRIFATQNRVSSILFGYWERARSQMRASATQDGEEKNMKIKKGLKLLSIFLAICAITLYLPNNIVTASAEQAQEPDSTEEETLYVET